MVSALNGDMAASSDREVPSVGETVNDGSAIVTVGDSVRFILSDMVRWRWVQASMFLQLISLWTRLPSKLGYRILALRRSGYHLGGGQV